MMLFEKVVVYIGGGAYKEGGPLRYSNLWLSYLVLPQRGENKKMSVVAFRLLVFVKKKF